MIAKTTCHLPSYVAESMAGDEGLLISITHPGESASVDGWLATHRVQFDDIEMPISGHVMFDIDMARELLRQIDGHDSVVVHCEAGMSRSAAVVKWLIDRRGFAFKNMAGTIGTLRHYNRHVYRTLDAAAGIDLRGFYEDLERRERMMEL